jgi:Na+-driven multidrug efflux pump
MGANRPDRSYQATITAAWIAAVITSAFFIIFSLFPAPVLKIFTSDPNLLKQFSSLLPLFAFLQITGALAGIFGAPLLGTGYLKVSLYVSLITTWIFQLPGMYLLGKYFGQNGLWISFVITSLVNLYLIALVFKKKNWMSKVI